MKEIRGLSLFSNVGVAEAYFEEIGVNILLANELIEERARFYQSVYPHTEMICGDITNDEVRTQIVKKSLSKEINFIIATPPCQGMSIAGNMNPNDERNQLIYYAIDVIKRVNPEFVFIENVPRALKTTISINEKDYLIPDYIVHELGNDYNFNSEKLVRAMDYGVPQMRERSIFLLVRKDLNFIWTFPEKESEVVTLRDAIGQLPSLDPELREGLEETRKVFPDFDIKKETGLKVSKWHYPPIHNKNHVIWMMHTPTGESATNNTVFYPKKKDGTRIVAHYNHYRRHSWDKPSRTITQNNGVISSLCCVHPGRPYYSDSGEIFYTDARVFSIYELLIVSSLPPEWPIPNWASDSLIRKVIGEGIPPLLVKKIMLSLLKMI